MVYPNPANSVLNIDLGETQSEVIVYNSLGQMVKRVEMASGTVQVNVEDLNAGVYFVKANGNVVKVIKK
ncbi:MAG: T9SS type A sorting domain-containing protein, partial [Bacteroidales bacterium]|nr:T9SS type A sorting domain-containing protein [Bacteroidales bacterium]